MRAYLVSNICVYGIKIEFSFPSPHTHTQCTVDTSVAINSGFFVFAVAVVWRVCVFRLLVSTSLSIADDELLILKSQPTNNRIVLIFSFLSLVENCALIVLHCCCTINDKTINFRFCEELFVGFIQLSALS